MRVSEHEIPARGRQFFDLQRPMEKLHGLFGLFGEVQSLAVLGMDLRIVGFKRQGLFIELNRLVKISGPSMRPGQSRPHDGRLGVE